MKLYYANTSPYARKVRVVAAEKGLGGRTDRKSLVGGVPP